MTCEVCKAHAQFADVSSTGMQHGLATVSKCGSPAVCRWEVASFGSRSNCPFHNNEKVEIVVRGWLGIEEAVFYSDGFFKLV